MSDIYYCEECRANTCFLNTRRVEETTYGSDVRTDVWYEVVCQDCDTPLAERELDDNGFNAHGN